MINPAQVTVLVIDDDEIIRTMVSDGLRKAGYDVSAAENGCYALEYLEKTIPDLILSDVMMPELDGMTLLERLRSSPATRAIPLIFITAQSATEDIITGFDLGADDYLVKPFSMPELLARVRAKLERPPVPKDMLTHDRQSGYLTEKVFRQEVQREIGRASRGGGGGNLAYLALSGWQHIQDRFGAQAEAVVIHQLTGLLNSELQPLDLIGRIAPGKLGILFPETTPDEIQARLEAISKRIMAANYQVGSDTLHLTPVAGYAPFMKGSQFELIEDRAETALDQAETHLDLHPRRYEASMGSISRQKVDGRQRLSGLRKALVLPVQILTTYLLGYGIPFLVYYLLDRLGFDISTIVYILVVIALVITGVLIWIEGFLSLKRIDPVDEPPVPYPPASAIIAAYLPNEAATILETVEAFLRMDYPNHFQVILAYNSPVELPVEKTLQMIAKRDPRLKLFRVANSTSKAQNVNAAVEEVIGEFVGIFDADHQPDPQSFKRAWRWLSNGYDVVQGHCLVRNGEASLVSRIVAVEFEVIYGSSHPGRTRWHQFGIFGGSNGYWKTDLLRQTRMRGFMLTEDIDSSFRALENGAKILSDPLLFSRELAPVKLSALWNQRMRWAQGWFQVSVTHLFPGLFSKKFSLRQKFGLFWLLCWREIYPWISLQILPLITFWVVKFHGIDRLDWLIPVFVLTTLFTLSVGPGQTLFAYIVGAPEIQKHKGWYWFYLLASMVFYTEFKNLIGRVAQIKEILHERQWKVTPRSPA